VKSVRWASSQLWLPLSNVHDVLWKGLKFCVYKPQLVQKSTHKNHDLRKKFVLEVFSCIEVDETYFDKLSSFWWNNMSCVCGTVSRQSCACGSEHGHDVTEHEHNSPKVNFWWALIKKKIISIFLFFFCKKKYSDWCHISGYVGEHCFASYPSRNRFLVRWVLEFDSRRGLGIFLIAASRTALGPTQAPI
jgi:hypothetical protein